MSYVTYLNQKGPPNKRGPKHWINHYNTHQTFFNSNKSSCPPPTAKKSFYYIDYKCFRSFFVCIG